ncbi:LysR family transcriptional regulator [Bordetella petrii]|uniref:LysR family transcriptional regulator n=1 Tax=Bordetella petrii TaxID=94624 RepID=UPI001E48F039|nr:LysR family transcriptional regulator [Bordetella petrii]MCD0501607.1 LysR family transcriptional regulator [Bordetella petrii]
MRRYSLAQIEALAAIAKLGSFQAAARHMNITQPTVSLRVRELEDALGTKLFERDGRAAKLNAEGAVALHYTDEVLKLLDELETRLRTGDPLQGTLRVGSSETVAIAVLPRIITLLGERYPRLKVELTVSNSFVLLDGLASNQLDLAILADPGHLANTQVEPLALAPVAWMGSRATQLPTPLVDPLALSESTILCMPEPSPLYEMMANWWDKEGGVALRVSTCNSLAMLARLVTAGVGIGVLPTCILRNEIQRGSVVSYRQQSPFRPLQICAAYRNASRSEGVEALVGIARRVMLDSRYFAPLK